MQIDVKKLQSDGEQYLQTLISELRIKEWTDLKTAKLKDVPEEELNWIENLWTHGFAKGAEISTSLTMKIEEALRTLPINPQPPQPPQK